MNTKKIDFTKSQNGNGANGQTNGSTTKAVVITQTPKETATPEKVLQELTEKRQPQPGEPLSIAEILQKVNRLNELSAQRESAKKTVEKLKGFNPELTEARTTVIIEDEEGNEFKTSNTEALKLIISEFMKYSEEKLFSIEMDMQKAA